MGGFRLASGLVLAAALGACGSVYTPGYVSRVLAKQDANTDDFLWKNSELLAASTSAVRLPSGDETEALAAFDAALQGESLADFMARTNTQSLIVVHRGAIVLERYAPGVDATTPQATFSVSKSITSLLVARALEEGIFRSIDDPITAYLPELRERDPRFDAITLAHLVDMRSGIRFEDETSFPFINADAPLVYYAADLRRVVLTQTRIESAPGDFHYNDYNPNLLALALERAAGPERVTQMRAELWHALGAENPAQWSVDDHGFPYWESGFVATARDLAKVGQLMLDEDGSALLPVSWRERILTYTPAEQAETYDGSQWAYRGGWWLILRGDNRHDVSAVGRFGQLIYTSPRNDVIVVRTGHDRNAPSDGALTRLFFAVSDRLGAPPAVVAAP